MKKRTTIWLSVSLTIILGCCIFTGIYLSNDRYVDYNRLNKISQFVAVHFPDARQVTATRDFPGYDVWIGTGTEIEFDYWENWHEIKVYGKDTIPVGILSLIPANIIEYVNQNFENTRISKINKERYGYEIELSTRRSMELKFNKNGLLIGIDD